MNENLADSDSAASPAQQGAAAMLASQLGALGGLAGAAGFKWVDWVKQAMA